MKMGQTWKNLIFWYVVGTLNLYLRMPDSLQKELAQSEYNEEFCLGVFADIPDIDADDQD